MFTDKGKNLVARKLGGVSDACFDYLSLGIGGRPVPPVISGIPDSSFRISELSKMRHEVLRVPVISALPTTNGTVKCMAELPNAFNGEFTEVALWTHQSNAAAGGPQTQILSLFEQEEGWKTSVTGDVLPFYRTPSGVVDYSNVSGAQSFFSPYDDILWTVKAYRRVRKEGFRIGTTGVLVSGGMSTLGSIPYTPSGDYISVPVPGGLPFDAASTSDELRLSYFVSPITTSTPTAPTAVKLLVEFIASDGSKARWSLQPTKSTNTSQITIVNESNVIAINTNNTWVRNGDELWASDTFAYPVTVYKTGETLASISMDATQNRTDDVAINPVVYEYSNATVANTYFTQYTQLVESSVANRNAVVYDSAFLWSNVVEMRVYADVDGGSSCYVGLDAITFVNTDATNPGYGMVAYDVAKNYETRGILTRIGSPTSVIFEVQVV